MSSEAVGSVVYPPRLILYHYTPERVDRLVDPSIEECATFMKQPSVTWLDVQGLGDGEMLQKLAHVLNLHPLALKDIVNVPQRPKFDEYDNHCLLVSRMVVPKGESFHSEQVSMVIGPFYVVTFQEESQYDSFNTVRDRIRNSKGHIRQQKADYLVYALLDALIACFFPILESYDDRLEDLQEEAINAPTQQTLSDIYTTKQDLLALNRAIRPQRDAIYRLSRAETTLVSPEVRTYVRDCYDQTLQVIEMVEIYREMASNLVELYLSSVNNRLNEVVKVLTIVSTIFIPLTFIVGVYGMNFNPESSPLNMPELNWPLGYPLVWLIMLSIAGTLIYLFWKWGWIGSEGDLINPRSRSR